VAQSIKLLETLLGPDARLRFFLYLFIILLVKGPRLTAT
jgi:hypothetical protein